MAYIDPIKFNVEIEGERSLSIEPEFRIHWPNSYHWVLQQLSDNLDISSVNSDNLQKEIERAVEEELNPIQQIDSGISDNITETLMNRVGRFGTFDILYIDEVLLVPLEDRPGSFFLISSSREYIDEFINSAQEVLGDISSIANSLGFNVDMRYGKDWCENLIEELNADLIDSGGFDNDFEEKVANEIRDYLTRCCETNVTLQFGSEGPETFEYDIFLPVSSRARILIEVKDASHEGSDLGKGKLIDTPRDKSDIIDTEEGAEGHRAPPRYQQKSESFVIIRGMDEGKFEQHKRQADRREIRLIKYDEKRNYLGNIEVILKSMIEQTRR